MKRSEAIKKAWERRKALYGPTGRPNPARRPSDSITDDQYRERLKSQVKIAVPTGCWEWQGWLHPKGYGFMSYRSQNWRVHRLAYTLFRGPIPEGMVICHTCDNRKCCNPLHLFIGTFDTNNKDMAAKGRCKYSRKSWTHCKHGHEFSSENTYICSRGFRHCRECQRIKQRGYWRDKPEMMRERLRLARAKKRLQSSEDEQRG